MPAGILIVEDDQIIAADLRLKVQGMGHEVIGIAISGEEAIGLAEQCMSASLNVEPIHARVLPLVKAEIPDLHEISFNGHQGSPGPSWMDLPADRMPGCGRLLRCRHVTRL